MADTPDGTPPPRHVASVHEQHRGHYESPSTSTSPVAGAGEVVVFPDWKSPAVRPVPGHTTDGLLPTAITAVHYGTSVATIRQRAHTARSRAVLLFRSKV